MPQDNQISIKPTTCVIPMNTWQQQHSNTDRNGPHAKEKLPGKLINTVKDEEQNGNRKGKKKWYVRLETDFPFVLSPDPKRWRLWKNSGYAAGLQEEKDKKKEKTRKRKVLSDKKKSAPLRASSFWRLNSYHIFILFNSIDFGLVIGKSNKSCTVMQSIDIILSLQPIAK